MDDFLYQVDYQLPYYNFQMKKKEKEMLVAKYRFTCPLGEK